jgi:glycerol-3-phosphate O-acyltransferase / dihydroxyacetone phosphate acyltransferase
MFANPITGAILSSSGAISVRRNPNSGAAPAPLPIVVPSSSSRASHGDPSSSTTKADISPEVSSRSALFGETSKALASNQVVAVFPEGTSYTQSSIVQLMPGAAWAAVEYARYVHDHDKRRETHTELKIVPVAIVYTDKSRYQSRVSHSFYVKTLCILMLFCSFLPVDLRQVWSLCLHRKKWFILNKMS